MTVDDRIKSYRAEWCIEWGKPESRCIVSFSFIYHADRYHSPLFNAFQVSLGAIKFCEQQIIIFISQKMRRVSQTAERGSMNTRYDENSKTKEYVNVTSTSDSISLVLSDV